MTARCTLGIWLLAASACSQDYVHVYLQGSNTQLTASPVMVSVAVYGGGARTSFDYIARFRDAGAADTSLKYTDFVLVLDGVTAETEIRATILETPTRWGGDARVRTSGGGKDIFIDLHNAELPMMGTMPLSENKGGTLAPFEDGVVVAWADTAGVTVREEPTPDIPAFRPQVIVPDPGATRVKIASRPVETTIGPDLFALVWRGSDGNLRLRTRRTPNMVSGPIDLGMGSDVHVACARKGGSFDLVTVAQESDGIWATIRDASGVSLARRLVAGPDPVSEIVGVVAAPVDGFVVVLRGAAGPRLVALSVSDDPTGDPRPGISMSGDPLSVALSSDGALLLVAQRQDPDDALMLATYFVGALDQEPPSPQRIAPLSRVATGTLSKVAVSACVIAWPETRDDGSGAIDLRFHHLDARGHPIGDSHLLNAFSGGVHGLPSAACATGARAYTTFVEAMTTDDAHGEVRLRRVPQLQLQP